jgi:hypothetical protein
MLDKKVHRKEAKQSFERVVQDNNLLHHMSKESALLGGQFKSNLVVKMQGSKEI